MKAQILFESLVALSIASAFALLLVYFSVYVNGLISSSSANVAANLAHTENALAYGMEGTTIFVK